MRLRMPELVFLFALGAVASLVGDHSHVATGTTEYLTDTVPFVWSSPIWFPLLVAVATVSLAELRLHLPALYLAFGVVVALLAEIAAKDRQPSLRSPGPGMPAPR